MLIVSLKKIWRLVNQNQLKMTIARSPVYFKLIIARSSIYFIVLMLISYYHFYVSNCTNNLCSVDVSVSVNSNINDPPINIFYKNFKFRFYNSSRLSYEVRKYEVRNLLTSDDYCYSDNLSIWTFFFIFLFSFNFIRKRKNDISYKLNSFLQNEIENSTFDILMPHTKPITIGIIYGTPNQSKFLEIFEEKLPQHKPL